MKRWALVVAVGVLSACGGGDSSAGDVVLGYYNAAVQGKASTAWTYLHPVVQGTTTREAFVGCMANKENLPEGISVKVVESVPGEYATSSGEKRPGTLVTLRATLGKSSEDVAVWVVDGKVAGLAEGTESDDPCVKRL